MSAVTKALANVVEADDAAGATLIGMAVYDYLADQAQELGPDLDRLLGAWALDRLGVAKRQLGRSYVEKAASGEYPDDSVQVAAEWLAGLEAYVVDAVAKADTFEAWRKGVVRRDQKGRFARDLAGAGTPDPVARQANDPGRVAPNVAPRLKNWDSLNDEERERLAVHQGQWEQAGRVLSEMSRSMKGMDRSKVDAILTVRKPSGQIDEIAFPLSGLKGGVLPERAGVEWDPSEDGLSVSLQAGRDASAELENRIAAFNTLGAVGGTALQRLAEVEPDRWKKLATELKMPAGQTDRSKLTQFFDRLDAGGRVLSQITGQERMGEWAQFVGSMGPQAEQVMGPYVQRAAYRYRGTEKTPDRELVGQLRGPMMQAVTDAYANPKFSDLSDQSKAMQSRADVSAAYLATTLPKDPIIRRLSQAAGNVLPSQGVLFDADGNIVSQAVGYADDHYLPFDLKGLARLRGGQYVRTRTMGGPTAEDIYAAVHTGARMLTVVSPSGVYTLEFDSSFRGARAGSDKARQMYDRYIKILDAVKGSGLYLQDIDSVTRNTITSEANRAYPNTDDTSNEMRQTMIQRKVNQARMAAMNIDANDIESLQQEARSRIGVGPEDTLRPEYARQYEDVLQDLIDAKRDENVRALKLNGEGYAVALQTLQQQFPYFLKPVRFADYSEFRNNLIKPSGMRAAPGARYAADTGYVGPGGLRPESTGTGYYGFQGLDRRTKLEIRDGKTSKPEAAVTVGGGDTPTVTTPGADTPTDASQAGATEPAVAQGGVWGRLRSNRPVLDKKRQQLVVGLMSQIGGVKEEFLAGGTKVADLKVDEALQSDPTKIAQWFLTRTPSEIRSLMSEADVNPTVGNTIMPVLQNRDLMEQAFMEVMNGARVGNADYFNVEGNTIGGKNTITGAAEWVADTSIAIANLTYAREPFVEPITDRQASEKHTGLKPQGFSDLTAISTRDAYERAWRDDPATATLATQLMEDVDGEELTIGQTAKVASDRIAAFNALEAAMPKLVAGDPDALAEQGVVREDLAATLGMNADDLEAEAARMDIGEQRYQTQRAWTLATVGRLLQYLPSTDGGDVDPKAWDPLGGPAGRDQVDKQSLDWEGLMVALRVPSVLLPRQLAR